MRLRFRLKDLDWWYWTATCGLLWAGDLRRPSDPFFMAVIALSGAQLIHFWLLERRRFTFPVQVRVFFLALVAIFWIEPLRALYWLPTVGTSLLALFDYCLLARTLSLMPWNRAHPLTFKYVKAAFTAKPVDGTIIAWLHSDASGL